MTGRRGRRTQTSVQYGRVLIQCSACSKSLGKMTWQMGEAFYELEHAPTEDAQRIEWAACPRDSCPARSLRASKRKLEAVGEALASETTRRSVTYKVGGGAVE